MAGLQISNVGKIYPGGVRAVEGVSVDIADGEFIVLVGPSGCGKSTILRMIAGLERISEGELRIGSRKVNDLEPGDRDIAMVFQNYALYPHMSVRRNMEYGLRNQGMPKHEIAERVAEAARSLRLEEYLDRKPRQLSGGQRQRVAMGRAIVRQPAVFLFDEPLSNLDAKLRTQLRGELKDLHQRLNATFVYVTHDQVEAMSLADRIIIMNAGKVEQIGTPMEVYSTPATRFVADFIGSPAMNFMRGEVAEGGQVVRLEHGQVVLPQALPQAAGRSVHLGMRPEHLRICRAEEAMFAVTVRLVEQLGADTVVHGTPADGAEPLLVRLSGAVTPQIGTELHLAAAPEHLHLFESEGGARVHNGDSVVVPLDRRQPG
ncbi:sn-glycerol-3-phosphate ABC transporter ATP-binding protein UgpC [Thalassococcus sp. S3]|uniref:sn-glycerol-3-phosphate ABC transporter ATP-binding protein UgpC n=1 Tax=Thalassococcus sp. S3 TaxID=2017482 RepID=UPI001023F9C0|nr:sn-glycerol-3-phosphate ABC transporter ATP-binding protein UgpC [Thalassococcus sp. S3]QBF33092.1 sn-glycerol-3-phosphate ABC transporter ATP-binding protein UgpC [Thalassococcus sp. S3]